MAEAPSSRRRILEVAAQLFRRRGFAGTGMREIAARAGLAKSSLYNHFPSKQAMLFAIVQQTVERATPALQAIAEAQLPAPERLRRAVAAHVVELIRDLDNVACFVEEGRFLEPAYLSAHLASRDEYERGFRRILENGIEAGEFRPVDVELTSLALLGMCNWVARWYRPDGRLDASRIGAHFGELAVRAVVEGCPVDRASREEGKVRSSVGAMLQPEVERTNPTRSALWKLSAESEDAAPARPGGCAAVEVQAPPVSPLHRKPDRR